MDSTTHTASKLVNNKYIYVKIYDIFFYDQAQLYIYIGFLISSLNKYKLQNFLFLFSSFFVSFSFVFLFVCIQNQNDVQSLESITRAQLTLIYNINNRAHKNWLDSIYKYKFIYA